jgi:hypothetical protein
VRIACCLLVAAGLFYGCGDDDVASVDADTAVDAAGSIDATAEPTSWLVTFDLATGESIRGIAATDDGILAVGSVGTAASSRDLRILKVDNNGNPVWETSLGGDAWDEAHAVLPRPTGFTVVGQTASFGTGAWIHDVTLGGVVTAQRAITRTEACAANAAVAIGDDTIFAGRATVGTGNDMWIGRVSSLGVLMWHRSIGGAASDIANGVTRDALGPVMVGQTSSFGAGGIDFWVTAYSDTGAVRWQKTYGDAGLDRATSVAAGIDGNGVLVAGHTRSFGGGDQEVWLIRLDVDGNILWQKRYGGTDDDIADSVTAVADGYVVSGRTESFGGGADSDTMLFKVDSAGVLQWQRRAGYVDVFDSSRSVIEVEGGVALGGFTSNDDGDWLLVKVDAAGNDPSGCSHINDLTLVEVDTMVAAVVSTAISVSSGATIADTDAVLNSPISTNERVCE